MKTLASFASIFALTLTMPAAEPDLVDIPLKDIDGKETSLAGLKGKAYVIVNVASQCGYTRQYSGLQALHESMKESGLMVLGFPCNDFGGQEPGSEAEIKAFCSSNYDVGFPMFSKVSITGDDKHPLYDALTGEGSAKPGQVGWNFEKFVVAGDGTVVARFDSGTEPDDPELASAIKTALSK